jgi:hypothetical protein|tara:strand:+ start:697 stop:1239 length:543 start_codon:yes stop_codon:yes gene_type:complete
MSTDPKYLGPGYWASWHLKSVHSDTARKKAEIARNIALDIANFPCEKCKTHAKEYVSRHPLMDAVKDKNKYSMFHWTVNFHNEVNLRLGKALYSMEDSLAMWTGDKSFCTEDCDQLEVKKEEEEKIRREEIREKVISELREELKKEILAEMKEEVAIEVIEDSQGPSDSVSMGKMLIKKY